jgi:hypothetical protein
MLISAQDAPVPFLCLRVWDTSGNIVPILKWFNTDTMIASVPTKEGGEARTEIGRFEFIVRNEHELGSLKKTLARVEGNLTDHIELVLDE